MRKSPSLTVHLSAETYAALRAAQHKGETMSDTVHRLLAYRRSGGLDSVDCEGCGVRILLARAAPYVDDSDRLLCRGCWQAWRKGKE